MDDDLGAWRASVTAERTERDALYLGPGTPLSPEARKAFRGLAWWPLDPAFRARGVRMERHPDLRPARLASTGEDALQMVEVGVFSFQLLGVPCRLLAFSPAPGESDEDYVLLPFRDETSGTETYGAGRYLDVEPTVDDVYELDFNRAYHPYCAYDDAWSCTLPPPENRLALRVEAGERL